MAVRDLVHHTLHVALESVRKKPEVELEVLMLDARFERLGDLGDSGSLELPSSVKIDATL